MKSVNWLGCGQIEDVISGLEIFFSMIQLYQINIEEC